MDFFTAVPTNPNHQPPTTPNESINDFADAIASRFGSGSILTARLIPDHPPPPPPLLLPQPNLRLPSSPMASMSLVSAPSSFTPVPPSSLQSTIDNPSVLILDIRPHAAFSTARIPRALSLSVPSTLLKRPLFGLDRLAAMLPSSSARTRFSSWRSAARIIVYDADASAIPEGSNINGLLRKFKNDGFEGDLGWLQGGFQAVWRERRDLVLQDPPTPEGDEEDETDYLSSRPSNPLTSLAPSKSVLRTRHLPMSAFSLSSTTTAAAPPPAPRTKKTTPLSLAAPGAAIRPAFNPFFDAVRQNQELSHGITERIPLRLPYRVRRRIPDLPFAWLRDIARRAARTQSSILETTSDSSGDEADADAADVEEGTEALAMQFYRIELAEQRRLMGVMEHHSKESGVAQAAGESAASLAFPFSITAGVEKGAKNRYRHIWPFEHARVRLHHKLTAPLADEDDYVNASYVQPLGTTKRYIATQGPLPATFTDFWTLCWEQNVHVIVMLTREVEGAMVKCGTYWTDEQFGPLRLRLLTTSGAPSPSTSSHSTTFGAGGGGGFFNPREKPLKRNATIKRTFELTHTGFPGAPPRVVTHLQYLDWADMNVPDDPRGVLGLVREVDAVISRVHALDGDGDGDGGREELGTDVDPLTGVAKHAMGRKSPVLLHCSAGVGRTGGFIAVDAVLDAVRREMGKRREAEGVRRRMEGEVERVGVGMDVDVEGVVPVTLPVTAPVKQDDGLVVHVPLVGWNTDAGATKTKTPDAGAPMNVDSEGASSNESLVSSSGASPPWVMEEEKKPATRKWAEAVLDETGVKPTAGGVQVLMGGAKARKGSAGSSASVSSSDESSFGSAFGSGSGTGMGATNSSGATSVSAGSSSANLKASFPAAGARPPFDTEKTATGQNKALGSSPLASSSAPWLGARTVRSPSPFVRDNNTKTQTQAVSLDTDSSSGRAPSVPPVSDVSSYRGAGDVPSSRELSPSLALDEGGSSSVSVSGHGTSSDPTNTTHPTALPRAATTVDYKEPRALHEALRSPPALSTYEEPIWQVVQDMREQRMSLCQSLRQYVFVHAAVIEGALQIVDEMRGEDGVGVEVEVGEKQQQKLGHPAVRAYSGAGSSGSSAASSTSPSKGKRGASPTELPKKDKSGEVSLSKRPSIKRTKELGGEVGRAAFLPALPAVGAGAKSFGGAQ